jgi:hypothetical protein
MPFRADKVRGHAEHVLDAFLRLRATYAVLDPLLFNSELRARWTSGAGIRGRETLVASLLYMCVLEASKLATDRYSQTPSLRNLDASLDDKAVVAELRNSYAEWNLPSNSSGRHSTPRANGSAGENRAGGGVQQFGVGVSSRLV